MKERKNSFRKTDRLTRRPQFVRLFDEPSIHRGGVFMAFYKRNEEGRARLGITIKGKISSVWRFKVKRTIREWFRLRKGEFGPIDLNIVIKAPVNPTRAFIDRLKMSLNAWREV